MSDDLHEESSEAPLNEAADDLSPEIASGVATRVTRGEGVYLFDEVNQRYIDLTMGAGGGNLGHCHPAVTQAVQEQAERLVEPRPDMQSSLHDKLAAQLQERLFAGAVSFLNDRSGATELAIRYARLRHQGQRHKIISFVGSDHGLTLGSLTASGQPYLQAGLGPLVAGATYCRYGDLDAVASSIDDQTSAILVQPIQTRDGMQIAERTFLLGLRQLADEHDLLLIFDESDVALGSSGRWLVAQTLGGDPDCLIIAAGLAGGLPLAAVLLREPITEAMQAVLEQHPALARSATSPLLIAASLAVFETIDSHALLENAVRCGELFEQSLQTLKENFGFVEEIRCLGLMAGLELDVPLLPLISDLRRRGIIVGPSGESTLRLQLPLNVDDSIVQTVGEIFHQAFEAVEREPVDA